MCHERGTLCRMSVGALSDLEQTRARIDRAIAGKTLLNSFEDAVHERGDAPALHWRTSAGWQALSWRDYHATVKRVAYGLRSLGFSPRSFGVILTRNRPEH